MYIFLVDKSSEKTKANNGSKQMFSQEVNSVSLSPNHNLLHGLECFVQGVVYYFTFPFSSVQCFHTNTIGVTFSLLTNTEIIIYFDAHRLYWGFFTS